MTDAPQPAASRSATVGILCGMGASIAFSLNDVAIKWLSGGYPLHQITFLRGLIAVCITLAIFVPLDGGYRALLTNRFAFHIVRGMIVIGANMSFYAALATMPLGEATAIYFVAPLFITALSVVLLGEKVGPRRWTAVLIGLAGVILVIRPGGSAFAWAALLPLLGAFGYALLQITTRRLGVTESASTMSFYLQFVFIVFSGGMGLIFGDGRFGHTGSPNLDFILRAWIWPTGGDWLIFLLIGVIGSIGAFLVSQAYRIAEAGLVAPFEYVAMPLAVFWSLVIWGDWPDPLSWIGIVLIAGAGIFVFLREAALGRTVMRKRRLPPAR